jgi:nucleoid-associated protein YgaU
VDFVVVGLGLGALSVLLGVVMLGWLAPRAQRAAARTASSDDAARDLAVAAEQRGTGHAFLYAGTAMLLATTGGLAGALDDRTGALLVTTTATVAAIGILLGGYLHRARNPVPRRRGPSRAAEPPAPVPERPVSASLPEDSAPLARVDRGPASGEAEPNRVRDMPVTASPGPESESVPEPADNCRDDAAKAEEEDVVVAGFVVPAAHPAGAPSPPSRPDARDDPS